MGSPTNALVSACGKNTQPQRALQLLEAMLHQGLLPDVITYNALVSACEKGALQQRALEILEAMLHQGGLPDGITYNALDSACEKGALQQRALAALGGDAAPRPPTRRDHLHCFGQRL